MAETVLCLAESIRDVGVFGLDDCCDSPRMLEWCTYDDLGDTAGETLELGVMCPPVRADTDDGAAVPLAAFSVSGEESQHHEARTPSDTRA